MYLLLRKRGVAGPRQPLRRDESTRDQAAVCMQVAASASEDLVDTREEVTMKLNLWAGSAEFKVRCEEWRNTKFDELNTAQMDERITEYHKMCFKMERGLPPNKKVPQFRDVIDVQRNTLPVIQALRNHALKDRHWEKIEGIIGTALPRADPEAFRLAFLLDLDVGRYKDAIVVVSTEATQESALEEMLAKINAKWAELEFQCVQFKDSKDMVILAGIDDITVALDDSLVSMSTILSSRCDLEKRVSTLFCYCRLWRSDSNAKTRQQLRCLSVLLLAATPVRVQLGCID